jgi:type IV pilus assembly protein PilV
VLVSLIIIAVGMLGIAKIQALAYASTGTASLRSLAAIEASSMAAAMRANRSYWTVAAANANETVTITQTNVTATDPNLSAALAATAGNASYCNSGVNAPCAAATLAGFDVQQWVTALNALLPGVSGSISCPKPALVAGIATPIGCTIQLSWIERQTAINTQSDVQTAGVTAMAQPTYTLYVEP